ncbi:MAG: GDSL-type esterase/lipase family protein [Devosia sp.]
MASRLLRWLLISVALAALAFLLVIGGLFVFADRAQAPAPASAEPIVATSSEALSPSSEQRLTSQEVALPITTETATAPMATAKKSFVILQIGDSHTAADLFTGEVRDRLQASFGKGGLFLPPGIPKAGVQSAEINIKADESWSYNAMASTDEPEHFWLSGYTATATSAGATISFSANGQQLFDAIDVSFLKSPGGGRAEILLDGEVVDQVMLDGRPGDPLIRRLLPATDSVGSFKTLAVRTMSGGKVEFSGVFIDQRQTGLSYLSVGFPGARVTVLNRISRENLSDDLARLNPDMLVLAFGTNEGFDDNLDIDKYRKTYVDILTAFRQARPDLQLVLVGPPPGARQESSCANVRNACGIAPIAGACWAQPPKLAAVREAIMAAAKQFNATYWDWGSALPSACDLEQGRLGDPALFGPDRVHLTGRGYRESADAFSRILEPMVGRALRGQ